MKIKTKAYAYLVTSLFTGALLPIVLTLAKGTNIFQFFMLTYLFLIPFALVLAHSKGSSKIIKAYLSNGKILAIIAAIAFLTYVPIQFVILYSEHYISASLTTAVFRTSPLLMLIFLPTVLREKLSKSQVIALVIAFLGVYIALTQGTFYISVEQNDLPIIIFLIFAALAYALGSTLSKKYVFDMPSSILLFNVFMFFLFAFLFVASGIQVAPISLGLAFAIIYISLVSNIAGFYMYFTSLRMLKTTLVTNTYFLSPFITFTFALLLLGEVIQPYYLAVAALVAVGIIIQKFDKIGGTFLMHRKIRTVNSVLDVTGIFTETIDAVIREVIKNGGHVLAMKLDNTYKSIIDEVASEGMYANVFTDKLDALRYESSLVRDTLGARENEMVIMKAGEPGKGEDFFNALTEGVDRVTKNNQRLIKT
ncbi:MAG: EamA family transporter [Candidatus Bathyarchaeia archaeon]|jgi:drug/metabolite transporter (DMT)-like permease